MNGGSAVKSHGVGVEIYW